MPKTSSTDIAIEAPRIVQKKRRAIYNSSSTVMTLMGQLGLAIVLFGLWEFFVRMGWIPAYLYGLPSGIFSRFIALIEDGSLAHHTAVTTFETVLGFAIGSLFGSFCGLALWISPAISNILRPFIIAINGLPKIALAPLIIVWFGIGIESKIALAAIITFLVSLITAFSGVQEVDNDLIRLMRSLGARRLQTFSTVVVPSTIPWIISGLRLNVGFALIGAVVGEYISSNMGLGYMIYYAGTIYDLNTVWCGLFALMMLALILDYAITIFSRYINWK